MRQEWDNWYLFVCIEFLPYSSAKQEELIPFLAG